VVVEDVVQFTAIFGEELILATDTLQGKTLNAYLAPTVRSFFSNGGRRCWITAGSHLQLQCRSPRSSHSFSSLRRLLVACLVFEV
jgi:hypothetical protein